uniref:SEFIR domain-containing protein n=1 Tax=Tetraodon nigroviridis TaxID=99883 RepID=H3C2A8_TETNG
RVFVTYEADNDKHVNDVINFAALLRHNGFDTHIDVFEQQLRSISKIDFMERFLSEVRHAHVVRLTQKGYADHHHHQPALPPGPRSHSLACLTQLQIEFIQNGSKNFRFIPILFPGATKGHVPSWLQNTHIYRWPRDQEDILRRLMRVEKYNPPPIGPLPTIVSIPI